MMQDSTKYTEKEIQTMLELKKQGLSIQAIADIIGRSYQSVKSKFKVLRRENNISTTHEEEDDGLIVRDFSIEEPQLEFNTTKEESMDDFEQAFAGFASDETVPETTSANPVADVAQDPIEILKGFDDNIIFFYLYHYRGYRFIDVMQEVREGYELKNKR